MNRYEKISFHLTSFILFISGIVYLVYKYFLKIDTDFGVRPHPNTSFLLHLHIILVPFLTFIFGYFFHLHVLPKIKSSIKHRKISGYSVLLTMIIMIFSGYLIQLGFTKKTTEIISLIHIVISIFWFLMYLRHFRLVF